MYVCRVVACWIVLVVVHYVYVRMYVHVFRVVPCWTVPVVQDFIS